MTQNLLVANNRFFPSGGPEQYLFNVLPGLAEFGWSPIPFAVRSNRNEKSPFADTFAAHPVDEDFLLYGDRKLGLRESMRLAAKVMYDPHARRCARQAIRQGNCRAVYGLQIAHYLYPEVVLAAADCDVPTVLRMSDYQLVCPAYNMLRDGAPCDLCQSGLHHALVHRCLKGSLSVTGARVAAMMFHRLMRLTDMVAAFVCPSQFMADKLARIGIETDRIVRMPTPIPPRLEAMSVAPPPPDGPALYVGGLYDAKGPQLLVEAALKHDFPCVVAGETETPLGRKLHERVNQQQADHITLTGFVQGERLDALYRQAGCVVVPSLWYENIPHVALEAMAHGRPVVASDLGSLPEAVDDGATGWLFAPGDVDALAEKILALRKDPARAQAMGRAGRERVLAGHRMADHLSGLAALFGRLA